jgi:hypothetical protein
VLSSLMSVSDNQSRKLLLRDKQVTFEIMTACDLGITAACCQVMGRMRVLPDLGGGDHLSNGFTIGK